LVSTKAIDKDAGYACFRPQQETGKKSPVVGTIEDITGRIRITQTLIELPALPKISLWLSSDRIACAGFFTQINPNIAWFKTSVNKRGVALSCSSVDFSALPDFPILHWQRKSGKGRCLALFGFVPV
jgi:hypothetical protein